MADNQLGVKTRAMIEKEGVNLKAPECQQAPTNPETTTGQQPQPQPHQQPQQQPQPQLHPQPHNLDTQGTMQNPRVELTRIDQNDMEEYVRKYSDIGLNWYGPNLLNTHIIDLIRNKIPINPGENRILFNSTELSDFFTISCFKLDLKTGQVHTYSTPAEDIGVACQQEEFDIETLRTLPRIIRPSRTRHRRTKKNHSNQKKGTHSRHHGLTGDRRKATTVLPVMGTLCKSIL